MAETEDILKRARIPYRRDAFMSAAEYAISCFSKVATSADLTNYQRDNLGTMLTSVINPNVEIREYQHGRDEGRPQPERFPGGPRQS